MESHGTSKARKSMNPKSVICMTEGLLHKCLGWFGIATDARL